MGRFSWLLGHHIGQLTIPHWATETATLEWLSGHQPGMVIRSSLWIIIINIKTRALGI